MPANSRFAVAVHVLTLMSMEARAVKSEPVAASVNTHPVVIRRILCALTRAGLATSQSGAAGGYRLAKPAAEISLFEVFQAVEHGEIFPLPRKPPARHCQVGAGLEAMLATIRRKVDAAVASVLSEITIEQLRRGIEREERNRRAV